MRKKARRCVVFLSVVAAVLVAAPSSRRPALNSSPFEHLTRAERQAGDQTEEEVVELKAETDKVCSGTPDFAKGVVPDPLPAASDVTKEEPVFEMDRRQSVLSLIHYPWEELGFSVVFMNSRAGYRAMTLTGKRRIEVYVRPEESPIHQAFDLAHELGHAFDLNFNDEERRMKWRQLRGINPSTPWFGCDACPDYATPAGDFAETFAFLLLGPGNFHSSIAPMPKLEDVAKLAEFCQIENVSEAFNRDTPAKVLAASARPKSAAKRSRAAATEREKQQEEVQAQPVLLQTPDQISPAVIEAQSPSGPIEVRTQNIRLVPVLNEN